MTKLDKPLRREVSIADKTFTLTLGSLGLKLVKKGHRNGVSLYWADLVNGDAGLAAAPQASVANAPDSRSVE